MPQLIQDQNQVSGNLRTTQSDRKSSSGFISLMASFQKAKEVTAAASSSQPLKQISRLKFKATSDAGVVARADLLDVSMLPWFAIARSPLAEDEMVRSYFSLSATLHSGLRLFEGLWYGNSWCVDSCQGEDFHVWILMLQDRHHFPSTETAGSHGRRWRLAVTKQEV